MQWTGRCIALWLGLAGAMGAQSLADVAAATAGGATGAVGGKKVSNGITGIGQKLDKTLAPAPGAHTPLTHAQAGPAAVPDTRSTPAYTDSVPPPPPLRRAPMRKSTQATVPVIASTVVPAPFVPQQVSVPLPPPREATLEVLKKIALGTNREEILKLGPPASRISRFSEGHFAEVFRYTTKENTLAVVHLRDGVVAAVEFP